MQPIEPQQEMTLTDATEHKFQKDRAVYQYPFWQFLTLYYLDKLFNLTALFLYIYHVLLATDPQFVWPCCAPSSCQVPLLTQLRQSDGHLGWTSFFWRRNQWHDEKVFHLVPEYIRIQSFLNSFLNFSANLLLTETFLSLVLIV